MERAPRPERLSTRAAYELQRQILKGELDEEALLALFKTLDRPLSPEEFYGFYEASEDALVPVNTPVRALDTCGTGGDGLNTFNVSTATGILSAALGVPVAKHGNRSASGNCGSADVLSALGVNIEMEPAQAAECLEATGFCFMFAQKYQPGFKHAAAARKKFGKRTYFNFLGPLLNPARAPYRLIGTSDATTTELLGTTLMRAGAERAWVAHSASGMDEISPCEETSVSIFTPHLNALEMTIDPRDYGFDLTPPGKLVGGNAVYNAEILKNIFLGTGTKGQAAAVTLNTAAALVVSGKEEDYARAVKVVQNAIKEGIGMQKLEEIVVFSKTR